MTDDKFSYTPCKGEFTYKNTLWNAYTTTEILDKVEKFDFLPSDIVVNTFPRSGTTLTQEIVWHIKNKHVIKKDAKYGKIATRFPFLESNSEVRDPNETNCIDKLEQMKSNDYRLIKTHCPFELIRETVYKSKPKCIVVFRNPRDVCLSFYHFYRGLKVYGPWAGEWEEFVEMFERGTVTCGSWLKWQADWWMEMQLKDVGQCPSFTTSKGGLPILFYTFEKMIKDPVAVITAIADFLEEPLTEEQMGVVLHNSNFKQMTKDTELNFKDEITGFSFLRTGQIGGWKEQFSDVQIERFKETVELELDKLGIKFDFES